MTYDNSLTGRTAVVTGAASGMGAATAVELARRGATVALLSRRADRLHELAEQIGERATVVPVDVTDRAAVAAAADRVGPIDLLVNAAGVMLAAPFDEGRAGDWDRMIDTNLTGLLDVTRAFTPSLLAAAERGGPADLLNISSIAAHIAFPDYGVYAATKAAVTHFSNAVRTELGPRGVRVTNLEPGLTASELVDQLDLGQQQLVAGMVEQLGTLTADEIADLVGYVVSRPPHVNLRQIIVLPTRQA